VAPGLKLDNPGVTGELRMKYLVLAGRLLIGGIFIYASIYKIFDPATFAVAVRNYLIIPASWSNTVALTLPWVEIVAGVFLILGIQVKPSALLTTGMLGVFLGAIIYAFSIGLDIDCGCFGSAATSGGRIGVTHIARDAALFLISAFVLFIDRGSFKVATLFTAHKVKPA
jgi:putative oxidoreductase